MSARRTELTRQAARLFAEKGYHGTSIGEIAEALGVQKGSLYAHIQSKQDLLYETMVEGARAFHAGLDAIPEDLPAANWAYTWLQPGRDTDDLADRFYEQLLDGMRGYATPR